MSIQPIRDKLVVLPTEKEEKTSGGILLTRDNNEDGPNKGTVVSVGSGHITVNGDIVPLEVSKGQVVVYSKGSGKKMTDNGEEYVILGEDEILAILN